MGMKTAVSLPDELFHAADRLARRLGISRSALYQRAIARFLEQQSDAEITAALDRVVAEEPARGLDPVAAALQLASLPREEW